MTTYQRPKSLRKAITSVLKQTFEDWELIIVDDYSNDGKTKQLCEDFVNKDSRIHYLELQFNSGTHARGKNEGFKIAKGNLIAYLDDDNQYRRDHLQTLFKYLGENDAVYGDRMLIDATGYVKKLFGKEKRTPGVRADWNAQLLSKQNYIDTSDILLRKELLEEVGGWDESLPKFADWNLWVRLAKAGFRFKRVPIIITDYYVHEGCNSFKHVQKRDPETGREMPTFDPDDCTIWPVKTIFGEAKPLKVGIFTLTMNRLDYTKKMYKSMKSMAQYPFDWFVVDNGSNDGTKEWVKDKATLIDNPKNVGISKGSNQALDAIGEDYDVIIKVDNDCEFLTDNWLSDIVDIYTKQRGLVLSPRVEGLKDNPGGVPRTSYSYVGDHFIGLVPHIGGISVASYKSAYKGFRWPDEDFLHGQQDYVFSQTALRRGFTLAYLENHIVEHMYGTEGQEKRDPEYFKNRKELKTTKYEAA